MTEVESIHKEIINLFESRFESTRSLEEFSSFVLADDNKFKVTITANVTLIESGVGVRLQSKYSRGFWKPSTFYSSFFEDYHKQQMNKLIEVLNNIDLVLKLYISHLILFDERREPEIIFKHQRITARLQAISKSKIIFDLKKDEIYVGTDSVKAFKSSDFFRIIDTVKTFEEIKIKRSEVHKHLM